MINIVLTSIIPAAFSLLPAKMFSDRAVAMLLAIGLQESKFLDRHQRGGGAAISFWQFEPGDQSGFALSFSNKQTRVHAIDVCRELRYMNLSDLELLRKATHDNDVLACAIARLVLWACPLPLPSDEQPEAGWELYLEAWKPGRPRPETWASNFREAWARVHALKGSDT